MTGEVPTPKGIRRSWKRIMIIDPTPIQAMLRELGFAFSDEQPAQLGAWADDRGKLRRIEARYSDGAYASLRIGADGRGALQQGISRSFVITKEDLQR